ncbi:MAG: AAA family ATPase [Fimbriimonadaceae bacterium]
MDNKETLHTPKIFAIANQKGGVGKTTTAVNLATALAAVGKKVLLIDLDPQGNASTGLGVDHSRRKASSYQVILGSKKISEAEQATEIPGLSVVPATIDLSGAELELVSQIGREFRLREAIATSPTQHDYILIDCPPSLGLLTINALAAAQSLLIPLQCEFYALEGLSHLLKTVELIRAKLNPGLRIHGVVLTMYDRRNKLTEHIENDVREYLGTQVYKTVIPRNVRVSEAPSHGKPALLYDLQCPGSRAYVSLASELLKRERAGAKELEAA